MKKKTFLFAAIACLSCLIACNKPAEQAPTSNAPIAAATDAAGAGQAVLALAQWYRDNEMAISKIYVVRQVEGEPYAILPEGADAYLAKLQESGLFSKTYLDNERAEFNELQADFEASPQTDGPPTGFDYDRILLTQDPDAVLPEIENPAYHVIKGDNRSATVIAGKDNKLQFWLNNDANHWMIDRIEMVDH